MPGVAEIVEMDKRGGHGKNTTSAQLSRLTVPGLGSQSG